jgi:hypothetical protein
MKHLKRLTLIAFMSLFFCCNKPCNSDSTCSEFTPPTGATCMMYVTGYYYDKNTNTCKYYTGGACNAPPFELKADCTPCECAQ